MIILELEGSTLIQIDSRLPCQTMALFCYTFCLLCRLHGPLPRGIEAIQCHDLIGRRGINTLQDFTFDYHKKKKIRFFSTSYYNYVVPENVDK